MAIACLLTCVLPVTFWVRLWFFFLASVLCCRPSCTIYLVLSIFYVCFHLMHLQQLGWSNCNAGLTQNRRDILGDVVRVFEELALNGDGGHSSNLSGRGFDVDSMLDVCRRLGVRLGREEIRHSRYTSHTTQSEKYRRDDELGIVINVCHMCVYHVKLKWKRVSFAKIQLRATAQ